MHPSTKISSTIGPIQSNPKEILLSISPEDQSSLILKETECIMVMKPPLMDLLIQNAALLHQNFHLTKDTMVEVNSLFHILSMKISSDMPLGKNNSIQLLTEKDGNQECSNSLLVICMNSSHK